MQLPPDRAPHDGEDGDAVAADGPGGRQARCRPVTGRIGAVAAAHPLAVAAGLDTLARGGSAVDAAISAQAVIGVVMPNAAGLGGDLLALVRTPQGVAAVAGTGRSPGMVPPAGFGSTGGTSVTVPGLVDGWATLHAGWGRLGLGAVLAPAVALAREGVTVDAELADAVARQRSRLVAGGAAGWPLMALRAGDTWRQPELADLMAGIARDGSAAYYRGPVAESVAAAVRRCGGSLDAHDLGEHRSLRSEPVTVGWDGGTAHVQPPPSQGVLLAMSLAWLDRHVDAPADDHLLVELTEAAFEHRSDCGRGAALLAEELTVDLERAGGRGGPRAYLHTAGVATADAEGTVVSSLVSVFDDFGSAVFVPEVGLVLNNRAGGFTTGANAPAPGRRPVHTLAPSLLTGGDGSVLALATPGADGQVQTLLQVLAARRRLGPDGLAEALAAPRWRSQDGALLVEAGHPSTGRLRALGHRLEPRTPGGDVFGGVVAAGTEPAGTPFAAADWRRGVRAGAV